VKPGALSVRVTGRIGAQAAEVWAFAGDFNGLPRWVPGIIESRSEGEGVGQVRHLTIKWHGPRFAIERQDARDDAAFDQLYSIVDSSLPVTNYVSRFRLVPGDDGSCMLDWSATFDAKDATDEQAKGFVFGAYAAGLGGLQEKFGS
jgi:hypothetical protein